MRKIQILNLLSVDGMPMEFYFDAYYVISYLKVCKLIPVESANNSMLANAAKKVKYGCYRSRVH